MDTIRSTTTISVQQRTPTKKTKPKKKNTPHPVKVVYISNPMKIKTSASEFRALVQELTGQDAESPPDPTRFHGLIHPDSSSSVDHIKEEEDNVHSVNCVVPPAVADENMSLAGCYEEEQQQQPSSMESINNFEPLDDDDVFTPQMIENISALLPASVFYESPHLNHWLIGRVFMHGGSGDYVLYSCGGISE
ncbi:Sigma factor binding protein 2, chloroplastic [Glycine max]|nr:Sigma factor binding protein 2, chloroplastic [Glycine max]